MLICIDKVLTKEEASEFLRQLQQAQWDDGARSAGAVARLAKRNLQLDESLPLAITLGNHILRRLGNHPQFISAALPSKIYPPRFNRYDVGGAYGTHVDGALMRMPGSSTTLRTDLSATLFLSEPADYDGGELQIEGPSGAQAIKLEPGVNIVTVVAREDDEFAQREVLTIFSRAGDPLAEKQLIKRH